MKQIRKEKKNIFKLSSFLMVGMIILVTVSYLDHKSALKNYPEFTEVVGVVYSMGRTAGTKRIKVRYYVEDKKYTGQFTYGSMRGIKEGDSVRVYCNVKSPLIVDRVSLK